MKTKKIITCFLTAAMMTASILPALAAPNYTLQIDGAATDIQPCITVPLRATAEKLGFKVLWNNGKITVEDSKIRTVLTIGENRYSTVTAMEGAVGMSAPFSLSSAPYLSDGKTYVPLDLFRVLLGNGEDAITVNGNTIELSHEIGGMQIANPFVTCDDLKTAEKAAGFSLTAPAQIKGYPNRLIQAIPEKLLQIFYRDQNNESDILIRKGVGTEDISSDYTKYESVKTESVGDLDITVKSKDSLSFLATWKNGSYSYSVSASNGMKPDQLLELVKEIE